MQVDDDIIALKRGWKMGFGDDDEFIDYFFANYDTEATRRVMRSLPAYNKVRPKT